MKAIAVEQFGQQPRLMELPVPEPARGEVLVAIEAASINPMDWKIAEGAMDGQMPHIFPLIMGFDGAGRVVAAGPGTSRFKIGDRVFGQLWGSEVGKGTFAQYAALAEEPATGAMQRIPEGISMRDAAALPTAGMTAMGVLEPAGCTPGQTLLIIGATGGVGSLVTQLAAAAGIHVIATARDDARARIVSFGASETINHAEEEVTDALTRNHPDGIDAVLDLAGDQQLCTDVAQHVRDGGAIVSTAFALSDELLGQSRIKATNFWLDQRPVMLDRISREVAAGRLIMDVEDELDLSETPAAIARKKAGGARGKTVIRI